MTTSKETYHEYVTGAFRRYMSFQSYLVLMTPIALPPY